MRVNQPGLARMAAAAQIIRDCRRELAARGSTIVVEATGGAPPAEWRHYPEEEVYDPASHAQYFYHRHPAAEWPAGEHGHFHTFLRAEGMPAGVAPLVLPEIALAAAPPLPQAAPLKRGSRDEVAHLVAIALDPRGVPIRLFTTNRWVTGETWYPAGDVLRMLDCFAIAGAGPSALLDRWLAALIGLFRPQIEGLLRRRDEAVMGWRRRRRSHVLEDPRLEITSSLAIDLDEQFALIDRLRQRPRGTARLPPMAEGWGDDPAG